MHRLLLVAGLAAGLATPATAQSWAPWHQSSLLDAPRAAAPAPARPKAERARPQGQTASLTPPALRDPDGDLPSQGPALLEGGPRPELSAQAPPSVSYVSRHAPGTIVIDHAARKLFLVQSASTALAYPVAVGREGFTWNGSERISRVASWPDWHPPAEMRERDPRLPVKMTGGIKNPLGARALYLGNTLYRIHGSNDARSIGRAASSGCFRMHNRHVVDLARRVGVGTRVVVINAPRTQTAAAR